MLWISNESWGNDNVLKDSAEMTNNSKNAPDTLIQVSTLEFQAGKHRQYRSPAKNKILDSSPTCELWKKS